MGVAGEKQMKQAGRCGIIFRLSAQCVTDMEGWTDPLRDLGIIGLELIMADLEMVEHRAEKARSC